MQKIIISTLAAMLLFGSVQEGGLSAERILFLDIKGHWAETSIMAAAQRGYADGYHDGSFQPERAVTRAEFVKTYCHIPKITCNEFWRCKLV